MPISIIQKRLNALPNTSGIYLFYNTQKELIYVGKATSLKHRVKSYFCGSKGKGQSRPIEDMIHEVVNIKWKETDSVLEAIILEGYCIKKEQPKYNILWRDDKSWNYIVITKDEYPKVKTVRQHEFDNIKFQISNFKFVFGPYPGLNSKATMQILRRLFHFSVCKLSKNHTPCFYYQLNQCLGVCTGEITSKQYQEKVIQPLVLFLRGNKKRLLIHLKKDMIVASKVHQYEEAKRIRNQIFSLELIQDVALISEGFFSKRTPAKKIKSFGRIEGYDISNLGSTGKVGSMVVFIKGVPNKSAYRKFKIKNVDGQSDVDCLKEVMTRRVKHLEWSLPDVFLIDGGKPQINCVAHVLKQENIYVPVVGICKGTERKHNDIFFVESTVPQETKARQAFIKAVACAKPILIRVRDEAHRFAISYQRKLRKL